MEPIKGIDVSRYQGEIDWPAVAADGVRFAMIKALQGADKVDPRFRENAEGAARAGIPFGVYVYGKANNAEEARREAEAAIDLISDFRLAYPVALDVESAHFRELTPSALGDIINAFCTRVKEAGETPLVYSNKDWLTNVIPKECSGKWPVWLAQWRKTPPDYSGPYAMWQYGKAQVAGIQTKADMDICYADFPAEKERLPVRFAVTLPRLTGEPALAMQRALIAANYKDSSDTPLDPDGVWGAKSQSAFDKLLALNSDRRD